MDFHSWESLQKHIHSVQQNKHATVMEMRLFHAAQQRVIEFVNTKVDIYGFFKDAKISDHYKRIVSKDIRGFDENLGQTLIEELSKWTTDINPNQGKLLSQLDGYQRAIAKLRKATPTTPQQTQAKALEDLTLREGLETLNQAAREAVHAGESAELEEDLAESSSSLSIASGLLELVVGFTPLSIGPDAYGALSGLNFYSSEELGPWERSFAVVGVVAGFATLGTSNVAKATIKMLGKVAANGLSKGLAFVRPGIKQATMAAERILDSAASKFGSSAGVSNFLKIVGNELGSIGPDISGAIKKIKDTSIWTEGKFRDSVKNAFDHWKRHKTDFPHLNNAIEYVEEARAFAKIPPSGVLTKVRKNGDVLLYHPESNIFVIKDISGTPRTMYKPEQGLKYFERQ